MISKLSHGFSQFVDSLIKLDVVVGFKKVRRYAFLALFILAIFNINNIATGLVTFFLGITEEIHSQKMEQREYYMTQLTPILADIRADCGADRILYFEFHNSEENLDGLPFKFFDLMKSDCKYGIPEVFGKSYKNVNAGMYTEVFNDLAIGEMLYCRGFYDQSFRKKYKGFYELLKETDRSSVHVISSVPGIRKPIGFIVLEWMDDSKELDIETRVEATIHSHIARIAALASTVNKK